MKSSRPTRWLAPLAIAALALPLTAIPAAAATVTIDIYSFNDFHGRIAPDGQAAGAAVLAGAYQQLSAGQNAILVSAGDNIGASTFDSFIQDDIPTIEALSMAGVEVSALGNHEFDMGQDSLNDRLTNHATYDSVSANVFLSGTNTTLYAPYVIKDIGGVQVAFVGATTPTTPSMVSPDGVTGLEFRDMLTSVNAAAAQARTDGAHIVVALVHDGAADTTVGSATNPGSDFGALVNGVTGVDAIISGHTHVLYNHDVSGMPVIQSAQYGEQLGHISFSFDDQTNTVTSATAQNYDLVAPDKTPNYPVDPAVKTYVDAAVAAAAGPGSVPVGDISADFLRGSKNPAADGGWLESRAAESTLGNFVADVQLWAAQQYNPEAVIAFMNPGGLRTDMLYAPDGVITYKEAASVQPFANTIMVLNLTGAQIKSVLEQQWQPSNPARPFVKLGISEGFFYTFDPQAPEGNRITSMTLNGEPIDPAATYTVSANSFLAAGGDNFTTFGEVAREDTGRTDLQAQVDWFAEHGTATPQYVQRSVGITSTSTPADDTAYETGETASWHLSALIFTSGEPAPQEVTVMVNGLEYGTVPVDPTIEDLFDLTGQVDVQIPIDDFFIQMAMDGLLGTPDDNGVFQADVAVEVMDESFGVISLPMTVRVGLTIVTAAPPTVRPVCGPANDVITPATTTGVTYWLSDYEGNTIYVLARPDFGYYIEGTTSWSVTDYATPCVEPTEPTPPSDPTTPGTPDKPTPTQPGATKPLPKTGSESGAMLGLALAFLLGGVGMTVARRRLTH